MRRTPRAALAAGPIGWQALEDGIVLAVDRQQLAPPSRTRGHEQSAGQHQRFLVREQDALAGSRRRQRRLEAGGADDRGHHRVGFGQGRDSAQTVGPGERPGSPGPQPAIAASSSLAACVSSIAA